MRGWGRGERERGGRGWPKRKTYCVVSPLSKVLQEVMSQPTPAASPARPPARKVTLMIRARFADSGVLRRARAAITSSTTFTPRGTSWDFMSTPAASAISQNARVMLYLRRENQCRLRPCTEGGVSVSRKKRHCLRCSGARSACAGSFLSSPYSRAARLIILLR